MLLNTFIHIPYVGESTERKLWDMGIRSWDDFLEKGPDLPNKDLIIKHLALSKLKYEERDFSFFSQKMIHKYHWRAYDEFRENACFIDIETTGLDKRNDELTVIGLYDGKKPKVYVSGKNLQDFKKDIMDYSYIVSFNGYCFDMPFIRYKFPDIKLDQFHVDLRFLMKQLGYTGGLKRIEKSLGISRPGELDGMTGWDAVKLWYRYKKGDEDALQTLIDYNICDIENLKSLMDFAYAGLRKKCLAFP